LSTSISRSPEERLDRLESEREIHALVHRYAELCDAAYDPDGLAALFTEDATWSSRTRDGSVDFGRYEGRDAIRAFFAGASRDLGPMTLHYLLAPRIELAEDGVSATGVCYLLAILDQRPASSPPGSADRERVLLGGVYSHRFRRVDGRWLIAASACDLSFEEKLRSAPSPTP
jgi:ketosteroid isomerase-like protein